MIDISIIIPTYNRGEILSSTLCSIFNQDLKGVEVIVVDNGSTDHTADLCLQFAKRNDGAFRYYYDSEPGLLTGRHLGASVAHGAILCFLDDDVELGATWIAGVREAFEDAEVQLATGPSIPKYATEPPPWLKFYWTPVQAHGKACHWLSLIDLGNKIISIHPTYVWGLNFCIRKEALIGLGGFHPDNIPPHLQIFQGDGETGLSIKASERGYKAVYHPSIKVFHLVPPHRLTLAYFEKRAFYQGICHSFSTLRHPPPVENISAFSKLKRKTFLQILRSITRRVSLNFRGIKNWLVIPRDIRVQKDMLSQKEKEGYLFHQQAFKDNQKVREWVLRENFFDYKLPV